MSVTVEDVLAGLAAQAAQVDFRKPDPLVMEAREQLVGEPRFELRRFFKRERMPRSIRTASGHGTRTPKQSALRDIIADALSGMPKKSWAALLTAERVDAQARAQLTLYLVKEARRSRRRDSFWPERIKRRPCRCRRAPSSEYLRDLVQLAVLHLEHPEEFRTFDARAQWFGVSRRNWCRQMEQPFSVLTSRATAWHEGAIKHIEHRLRLQRQDTG